MTTQGPDPRAALRGFMALVLDMVRVDPERRPSAEMQRWHRDLANALGVLPEHPRTNRELLDGALRLSRVVDGDGHGRAEAEAEAEVARREGSRA